jgi:DNA-binding NarL/FixJ family response regulator
LGEGRSPTRTRAGVGTGLGDVTVLAVDDHDSFQIALSQLLEAAPGFTLVGQIASGEEAIEAVDALDPDLVLMDVNLPGIDGGEATRAILRSHPGLTVWLVSIEEADSLAQLAESCGAQGWLRKQDLRPRLLRKMWAARVA